MNKIRFNINTPITISDNTTLKEIGSILQQFTKDYLYVCNGVLKGVKNISDIKETYRLVGYDGCFQLIAEDMSTMLYCFKKELADHLNKPKLFRSDPSNINPLDINYNDTLSTDKSSLKDFLGDIRRDEPRDTYTRNLSNIVKDADALQKLGIKHPNKSIIQTRESSESLDSSEKEMKKTFKKNVNSVSEVVAMTKAFANNNTTTIVPKSTSSNIPPYAVCSLPIELPPVSSPSPVPSESNLSRDDDISVQSRKNGTNSIVNAIKIKRKNKKFLDRSKYNKPKQSITRDELLQGKYNQNSDSEYSDKDSELVKDTNNNSAQSITYPTRKEVLEEVSEDNEEVEEVSEDKSRDTPPEICIPNLPAFPLKYANNVYISSLPLSLQESIISTVLQMKENLSIFGSLYYNGTEYQISVDENNIVNVYDIEGVLDVPRLVGDGGYPGLSPIAQFTVHQYRYKLCLERSVFDCNVGRDELVELGRMKIETLNQLIDIYGDKIVESICNGINNSDGFSYSDSSYSIARKEIDGNDKLSLIVTVLYSTDSKYFLNSLITHVISDHHVIVYRLDEEDNDTSSDHIREDEISIPDPEEYESCLDITDDESEEENEQQEYKSRSDQNSKTPDKDSDHDLPELVYTVPEDNNNTLMSRLLDKLKSKMGKENTTENAYWSDSVEEDTDES
jgi:hypothetical protein